ncbi:MAG: hypothetical protein A3G84_00130 [Chloroflexi bacterium RIFCSPLOWO2_12_FULL_71_12]|nr:MAG: hypothetical protein A3H36_03340 [Chloroflexi bacterium RIFCSPLOWO2_02_FULL_71_16]OGO73762.1 MAG: hypothetical protein A3G84_00130 [Chloroflexi bacterium RIFCSPLOWO2_12_FULL_71_12]
MEWLWVLILAVILFGPIVWVFIRGRRYAAPPREDAHGASGYGAVMRDKADIESIGGSPGSGA